ncbi:MULTISPECIES: integration host factor subunit beta [Ralstonia]|jgi:integration host factor subunit beta|uniref:Integration host factor subunit beta n=3 Tax=Ralstonia TaxID=48736 RepID=A0AAD2BRS3_9RALS|nr:MULTISPECIES: integration host factor subunit beta [Ralstonia]MEA3270776.1 integration host factor subunit beta [Pseudomonadota bacterium]ENZ78218.1 integration host factor, beta subunit [Ralstonia pickettii OR214]MBB0024964.1 integration host factor subunit beta [Ralstonia pickettii]MBB0034893.1 integration host factor subunit beta [Ralstonia pickettii]MBB0098449.1 integration host factor subunit beta [Ralstonia pickettii]
MPMTKSELVEKLAARFPQLLLRDADIAVKTILDAMSDALADGHRIEIRGFGSFGLNRRPPRVGRNPKSGEKVLVPEKRVPHFKAGKELRERVDRSLERQGEPSSEGESAVSLAAVKAARQVDSSRQAAGFPVDTAVPLAMSR